MSSGKRFEKTFTRNRNRKKKDDSNKLDDDLLPTTASSSPPLQNGQSHIPNNNNNNNNGKSKLVKNGEKSTNKNNNETDSKTNNDNNKDKKKSKKKKNASDLEKLKQRIQNEDDRDETTNHKRIFENDGVSKKEKKPKKDKQDQTSDCVFPTNRIFRIVKSEASSDSKLSAEAVFLINKATEKFIELFSKDAYDFAREDQKSFVGYKHLASAVCKKKQFDFLGDCVPEKVTAEKALSVRKPAETLPV